MLRRPSRLAQSFGVSFHSFSSVDVTVLSHGSIEGVLGVAVAEIGNEILDYW